MKPVIMIVYDMNQIMMAECQRFIITKGTQPLVFYDASFNLNPPIYKQKTK